MTMPFVMSVIPILVIVTAPLLLIFGYKYKIKYLYPKTPLGRTMYIVSSIFSGIVGFASLSIYNYANNTNHIIEGIVYALIGYSFAVFWS